MTYQKQAVKTINQYLEDADGNWAEAKRALDLWCVEVLALGKIECMSSWNIFVHALDDAWLSMAPEGWAGDKQSADTSSERTDDD